MGFHGAKAFEFFYQGAIEVNQQRRGARHIRVPRRVGAIEHQADDPRMSPGAQLEEGPGSRAGGAVLGNKKKEHWARCVQDPLKLRSAGNFSRGSSHDDLPQAMSVSANAMPLDDQRLLSTFTGQPRRSISVRSNTGVGPCVAARLQ